MAVIEFILVAVVLVVGFTVMIGALAILGSVATVVVVVSFLIGWIPIFVCITDATVFYGHGFMGTWAQISTWIYGVCLLGTLAVLTIKPDPDGLPPTFKFLALLYTAPVTRSAHQMGERGVASAEAGFRQQVASKPSSYFQSLIEARQLRRAAKHIRADGERIKSAAEVSEAALEIARLKERNEALEEILRNRQNRQ